MGIAMSSVRCHRTTTVPFINNREHQAPDGPQQEHKSGQPDSGNNKGRPGQEMKYTKNSKCLLEVAKGMAGRRCVMDSLGTKIYLCSRISARVWRRFPYEFQITGADNRCFINAERLK